MKTYIERKTISMPSQRAWAGLKTMNIWLPTLSTNKDVTYDKDGNFFVEGRKYNVVTKEGITMKSSLFKIDESHYTVEIHAQWGLLKSLLSCSVKSIAENKCEIIRTQAYPGIVGKLFTSLFNKRESGETSEYLDVWEKYSKEVSL